MTDDHDPIAAWQALVHAPDGSGGCEALAERMRERRLTFGDRLLCPFLRPFFLSPSDEQRVRHAAETMWGLGEKVAGAARERPELLADLCLSDAEIGLAAIDPGYGVASTAGRADAFLLPGSLQFAEYNAESPAGPGYSQRLAELFDEGALMARFREAFDVRHYTPIAHLLQALLDSYRDWGGTASPPQVAIVDFRGIPTWSEFELLREAFEAAGVPTLVADPRELEFDGRTLGAQGRRIDLVYRRVLINDIVARPDDCRALVDAYRAGAACVANSLRCKIAHKKAFFAVLTDERYAPLFTPEELDVIAAHVPWTRVVRDQGAEDIRRRREQLVLKPNDEYGGTGVTLGWETAEADWEAAIGRALAETDRGWVAQERIHVRREIFPVCGSGGVADREMLVDFAPYVFRGRVGGFLTRLSATGLANVTSGGGQVPAFVAENRE